ncbi:inhibitor of Bruton tyrosine kinase [Stomoxys calcitrans]|uniref:inhibitor of Bruton tyrosine kinase n=1 Tax=Stomoxys calcitrans TaxID=35570 RepID=UPI0027E3988E|nr:inhibitor of Bruton tyrosine kinase [Stomoxys calcitrans]
MFNPKNYEYDCTSKCRLRSHGNAITSALTKRSMNDEKLSAYLAKTCCNFADIVDDLGRSAVHMSASVDRYDILEWLLNQGAIISGRDFESGSTPLHRAIFYGCIDCAVLLLRYGASLDILDEDTRSPLQQVCRLGDFPKRHSVPPNNELLVWGSNKNYNLGVNNDQGTDHVPQMLDFFRKEQISIQTVALGAYHSLFLDKKSHLYTVGHGKGGRLGIGNENTLSTPKRVKITLKNAGEEITCISVSRKHSLVLTNRSLVFSCGLNEDHQLGVRDAGGKLLNFKEVVSLRDQGAEGLQKVIARDMHSLAYSEKCIFVWGTNSGQMGFDANTKNVTVPKMMKLPPKSNIQFVEANNAATVVVTKDNNIILFHNYKMKVIKAPNYESLKSIAVVEGENSKSDKGSASALKLLVLTQTNVVFLWYQLTQNFYRCSFSPIRLKQIDKIFYRGNQMLILSQGDVYRGKCQQVPLPQYYNNSETSSQSKDLGNIWSRSDYRSSEMAKDFMIRIDLQHILQIDRAVDIFCDDDFASFACLQESSMKYFKLPALNPEEYTFKKLYHDVSEYDAIHDIVFHVDSEKFPAHKFLIHARASGLKELISSYQDKDIYLNMQLLTGKMFEIMLKFIYSNYLPNEQDLEDIQRSLHTDAPSDLDEVCQIFLNFVEQFHINNLANYLKYYLQQRPFYLPHIVDKSKYRFNRLKLTDFPNLYDIRIICENNIELPAHKCVLVARLEYFEMMFTHTWAEQTTINLTTVPYEYMLAIVEFLYSLDVEHFRKQQHRETFLYNMIVFCDQFFIERLRKVCENLLLDKISVRKCGDMLEFATMYNCEIMKKGCLDFICQNLARVLLQKSLYNCEPEAIKCINNHYRGVFKDVFDYRMITPNSEAVDDECLLSFVDDFQVDLFYRMVEEEQLKYKSLNKSKSKVDGKTKHSSTRQYEREAITSMMETMNITENKEKEKNVEKSQAVKDAEAAAQKLQSEAKSWMKVVDKKDQKKKLAPAETAVKTNEILKKETSTTSNAFITLNKTGDTMPTSPIKASTPEKDFDNTPSTPGSAAKAVYNFNLADLATSPREKLSQKQRKRLSSESSNMTSWRAPATNNETKPIAVPQNAWGVVPAAGLQSPTNLALDFDAPTGSSQDPTSFANMMRSNNTKAASATSPSTSNNSFTQILAEEKRQKEYYERVRNKSLALTQIEEQAIAELKEFYNVDNVVDEIITIQRKPVANTINFAIWQRN